jgi:hypothetical protein
MACASLRRAVPLLAAVANVVSLAAAEAARIAEQASMCAL